MNILTHRFAQCYVSNNRTIVIALFCISCANEFYPIITCNSYVSNENIFLSPKRKSLGKGKLNKPRLLIVNSDQKHFFTYCFIYCHLYIFVYPLFNCARIKIEILNRFLKKRDRSCERIRGVTCIPALNE